MTSHTSPSSHMHWQPIDALLAPSQAAGTPLVGFDPEFSDLVDYIIKITHRIWEQKNAGLCYRYYSDHCPLHTLGGYSDSVEEVVQNTLNTIAAFPDRSLIGENVVWSVEPEGAYYSSHRITSTMTHSGPSEFGPATGRTGRVVTIADCVCKENQVIYEWLMRDNSFLVKQLGLDPIAVAQDMSLTKPRAEFYDWWQQEFERLMRVDHRKELGLVADGMDGEAFARSWLQTLFNQKLFGAIQGFYHLNARVQWPGGRHSVGLRGVTGTMIQWLAQFSSTRASVDHVAVNPFDDDTTDIAIRWSLAGTFNSRTHGLAPYVGIPVLVLASTHLRISGGRIAEEWTVFDELSLYANLFRQGRLKTNGA